MAQAQPGLQPRKLEGEVEIDPVSQAKLQAEGDRSEQKPAIETKVEPAQAPENTEATAQPTDNNVEEAQAEQPVSNRANERIQTLDREKNQARAEAEYYKQLAQRVLNVQPQQPVQSEQEMLAKAYRTYDPTQGYPTDPKEYSHFVATNAANAARIEAQRQAGFLREQQETREFIKAYPNAGSDPLLMGAVSALRLNAQQQGGYLSYKDAADLASKQMNDRVSKKVVEDVANNDRSKDEAYVESTRGASASSRAAGTKPDVNKMSLEEMEAFLKTDGSWDRM